MLDAARELFLEQGYGATTIEQIARRAGVSKPTVFNAVGNKVEVFRTVQERALNGGEQARRLSLDAPDLETAVELAAAFVARVCRRYSGLHVALGGAAGADPAMAELYDQAELDRREVAGQLLDLLTTHAPLRIPRERAQDRLWVLMAPDSYARLVGARRWPHRAYREWLVEEICTLFE